MTERKMIVREIASRCGGRYRTFCPFAWLRFQLMSLHHLPRPRPAHITRKGMYAFCWVGCLTVMYDAQKVGLIQIEDIKKNNDYAMWLKVITFADCYHLPKCLARYRRGRKGSISTHNYAELLNWHYRLFRQTDHKNRLMALGLTIINMICGIYKKLCYVSKIPFR